MRRSLVLFLVIGACSRREDAPRAVPTEMVKSSAPPRPKTCACDSGFCVEDLCADVLDSAASTGEDEASCKVGKRRAVHCAGASEPHPVWGTDVYTTDSSVCTAALHAGKIAKTGGDVVYELRAGQPAYSGTLRNGVQSNGWAAYGCSFVFSSKGCGAGLSVCRAACTDLQRDALNCGACGAACATGESCRGGRCMPGLDADFLTTPHDRTCKGTHVFVCPPHGAEALGTVWGTDVYTNDSAICPAAAHAGKIALATGGTVTIEMSAGLPAYKPSTRHGVASLPWGSWTCSYRFK